MRCGVNNRHGLDLAWLWLWCKQAASALIQPLAWEFPYAVGVALKKKKEEKKRKRNESLLPVFGIVLCKYQLGQGVW